MKKIILLVMLSAALLAPQAVLGAKTAAIDPVKLQDLGVKMIDKRVTAIQKYDDLLSKTKYVSQPILDQIRGELNRVKGELEALKTKIQGETDIATLKADVKSIGTNYRVYQVLLPQSSGFVAVDRIKAYEAQLNELKSKTSSKADELEKAGKDVSAIRSLITTAEGNLSAGSSNIAAAESKFAAMTISDPEGARTLKLDGKTALVNAKQNFSEARKNLRDAVQEIKKLAKPANTSTQTE